MDYRASFGSLGAGGGLPPPHPPPASPHHPLVGSTPSAHHPLSAAALAAASAAPLPPVAGPALPPGALGAGVAGSGNGFAGSIQQHSKSGIHSSLGNISRCVNI